MSYTQPVYPANPIVQNHWDVLLRSLKTTFQIAKLWDEFNIKIKPYDLGAVEYKGDYVVSIRPLHPTLNYGTLTVISIQTHNNSLAIRSIKYTTGKVIAKKTGQMNTNEGQVNNELINAFCDEVVAQYKREFDSLEYHARKKKKNESDLEECKKKINKLTENITIVQAHDSRIDVTIKGIEDVQIIGQITATSIEEDKINEPEFDLHIRDASVDELAQIADIFAKRTKSQNH